MPRGHGAHVLCINNKFCSATAAVAAQRKGIKMLQQLLIYEIFSADVCARNYELQE